MNDPSQRARAGQWLDDWTPRILKLLGLLGMLLSLIAFVLTKQFEPILFGGSLTAASGGYLGDAVIALKQAKPG